MYVCMYVCRVTRVRTVPCSQRGKKSFIHSYAYAYVTINRSICRTRAILLIRRNLYSAGPWTVDRGPFSLDLDLTVHAARAAGTLRKHWRASHPCSVLCSLFSSTRPRVKAKGKAKGEGVPFQTKWYAVCGMRYACRIRVLSRQPSAVDRRPSMMLVSAVQVERSVVYVQDMQTCMDTVTRPTDRPTDRV